MQNKGYTVIDTDIISKNLSKKGKAIYNAIINVFGNIVINGKGELNRKKIADIVFNDKKSLEKLNSITHPLIEKELKTEIEKHINKDYVFILVPLLFETNLQNTFDKIWLILADEKIRIIRATKRDKTNKENIIKRIKNQINYEKKAKFAHNVLYNNSSEEEFAVEIENALKTL